MNLEYARNLGPAVEYALENLDIGDVVLVFEDDGASGPGVSSAPIATASGFSSGSVACAGIEVVIADGAADPRALDRDDLTTTLRTYARTYTGTNRKVITDGEVVVLAYDRYVEVFEAATAASRWVFDLGAGIASKDIAMSNGFVYVVHALTSGAGDSTANRQMHKIGLADKSVGWSFQHSASGALRAIAVNGRQVFVGGDASSYLSGATLRALNSQYGSTSSGEGNNGTDSDGRSWDVVSTPIGERTLDCDARLVYVGGGTIASNQIEARGKADGQVSWGWAHPSPDYAARHVFVDQDLVLVCYRDTTSPGDGSMIAHDKYTGCAAWRYGIPPAPPAEGVCCVSDSQRVWYLGGTADPNLRQLTRGNRPTMLRLIDPATHRGGLGNWTLQP